MTIGTCVHKEAFPNFSILEVFGTIVLAILLGIANAGGIGGGGIIVPVLMIFFKFEAKRAVAISNLIILTSTIARFVLNIKQTNENK